MQIIAVSCAVSKKTPPKTSSENKPKPSVQNPSKNETVKFPEVKPHKRYSDSLERLFPVTLKDRYKVAVLLPLYLDLEDRESQQQSPVSVSQEFYKGLLVAADTLKYCGIKLNLDIIDCENKLLTESQIYDSIRHMKPDLIMGPLLESRLYFIDSVAKTIKSNRVSPIIVSDKCQANPYYFESLPSSEITGAKMAEYVSAHYADYNIIMVINDDIQKNSIERSFVSSLPNRKVNIVSFKDKSASTYTPDFNLKEKNFIFIPSKNEAYVSAVLTQLRTKNSPVNPAKDQSQKPVDQLQNIPDQVIEVGGLFNWTYFKGIEGDLWEKLHVVIPSPYYVDYYDENCKDFIKSYRAKFSEEPGIWAFMGFDELVYYGQLLNNYGKYFQIELDVTDRQMLHTFYQLRHDPVCNRWRNNYVNILRFDDFQLKKVNP